MTRKYDVMVDLETLSKYPDGVVLSIALVPFLMTHNDTMSDLLGRGLYLKLHVKDQIARGRTVHKPTVEWWKKQSEEAKAILIPSDDDVLLPDALDQIDAFCAQWCDYKESFQFNRGTNFDFPFFQSLYRTMERPEPMDSWKLHCTKSMIRTLNHDVYARYDLDAGLPKEFIPHNALHDACVEVLKVQELCRKYY